MKAIVCRKRAEGAPFAEFADELRARKSMLRAVHDGAHVISFLTPQSYAKSEPAFDAIEEIGFASAAEAQNVMQGEVWRTFAKTPGSGSSLTLLALPHVVRDSPAPDDAPKSFLFIRRREDLSRDAFVAHWRDRHAPIAARIPSVARYEQNYVCNVDAPYDGVAIVRFVSAAAMKAGRDAPAFLEALADEPNFLAEQPRLFLLVTEDAHD